MNKYKIINIRNKIYMYNGEKLIATYLKDTKMLYTYGLSKNEKRKVSKVIKSKIRASKMIIV